MYYQNVRGLRTKLDDLHFNSTSSGYNVLAFTETWLIPSISDAELGCGNFSVFRRDRFSQSDSSRSGGGVLIAVSSSFSSIILPLPNTDVEQLAIFVSPPLKYILVCSYVNPGSHIDVYLKHVTNIRSIMETYPDVPLCILGDFNLPDVEWLHNDYSSEDPPFTALSSKSRLICNELIGLGLSQFNFIKNHLNRTLDLVFMSLDSVGACNPPIAHIIHPDSHHPPIEVTIRNPSYSVQSPNNSLPSHIYRLNFNRADYNAMNSFLGNINWSSWIDSSTDLSVAYSSFISILRLAIDLFTPRTLVHPTSRPKWHNRSYRNLLNAKSNAHKRWKKSQSTSDRKLFLQLRKECYFLGKFLRREYFDGLEASINADPKQFWSAFNSRRSAPNHTPLCSYQSTEASSLEECSNLFASFFQSSFEPQLNDPHLNLPNLPVLSIPPLVIDPASLKRAIDSLKPSTSPGPDGIPPLLVKRCPALFEPILTLAIRSVQEGTFFDEGKVAHIIPIFKKGSRTMVENYRPIAKLSVIPKLIEGLVASHLQTSLTGQINQFQHGFIRRRSTVTNLASFCQVASDALDNNSQLDVLYVDLAKAFDKVDHTRLILKLKKLGLPDSLTRWISSFLSSWSYRVKLSHFLSNPFSPTSGVPQGTHLGPILFILFTLDLPLCLRFCVALSFADDTKIFRQVSSLADTTLIQLDINSFVDWCASNGLHINTTKSHIMSIHNRSDPIISSYFINGSPLSRVDSIKDLGVTYNNKMDFSPHIHDICSRSFRILGCIKRSACLFSNPISMVRLFNALVRSLLEHASSVWNPYLVKHISLLESIQRNFTRFTFIKFNLSAPDSNIPSYHQRCEALNLQLLADRRAIFDALFVRGVAIEEIDSSFLLQFITPRTHEYPHRRFRPLMEAHHRTNRSQNAPIARCTHTLNTFFDNSFINPFNCSRKSFIEHCRGSTDSSH